MKSKAEIQEEGETGYKFKGNKKLPEHMQIVQVLNGNGNWIEAQFRKIFGNRWSLMFDDDDICADEDAVKFFDDWRPDEITPMVKDIVK